ncbi:MAG TPA: acetolactate synthase small subunit [bacterium]|nr:acetolactate synthase small subunit [bacterium]
MRHTISVLVNNHAGVLSRVSNLFSARGYNIDSLVVGVTDDPKVSRITIVVKGDDRIIDQVEKQLNKLIDVIKVFDLTHDDFIARDLALIKVKAEAHTRSQVMEIVQCFDGKIVDVALKSFIIEVTGKESKINAMVELLSNYGILELVRTGEVAISRGKKVAEEEGSKLKVKAGKAGQSNL